MNGCACLMLRKALVCGLLPAVLCPDARASGTTEASVQPGAGAPVASGPASHIEAIAEIVTEPSKRDPSPVAPEPQLDLQARNNTPASAPTTTSVPRDASAELLNLQALVEGKLDPAFDLRSLFAFSLTDKAAVQQRMEGLEQLIADAEAAVGDLDNQLDPARAAPDVVPRPALVDQRFEPPEPLALEPLEPPVPPPFTKNRRLTRVQKRAVEEYRQALVAYKQEVAARRTATSEQAAAEAAYQAQVEAQKEARAGYERSVAEARTHHLARMAEMRDRRAKATQRQEMLKLRHSYLAKLSPRLEAQGVTSLRALVSLGESRDALRVYAGQVSRLAAEAWSLQQRLSQLLARAESGALVGFVVDRDRLVAQATAAGGQVAQAAEQLEELAEGLATQAAAQEEAGTRLLNAALRSVASDAEAANLDGLFLEHFREVRRLRKMLTSRVIGRSASDIEQLIRSQKETLPSPERIGTVAEAGTAVSAALDQQVTAMGLVDASRVELGRWQIAFERQVVSALETLVSDAARSEAYAFSAAYLYDLQDESSELLHRVVAWARERGSRILEVVTFRDSAATWDWLSRIAILTVLAFAYGPIRRRVPALMTRLVRAASHLKIVQGRVGTLVRWAGLLQTVTPPLLILCFFYIGFWVIGREHVEIQIVEVPFRWLLFYLVGRDALIGLTRRVSRGRPALIDVSEPTVALLRLSYGRLGLVLVITAAAYELTARWLTAGRLTALIDLVLALGLAGWFLRACFDWRRILAGRLLALLPEAHRLRPLARRMEGDRRLALLSPIAVAGIVGQRVYEWGRELSVKGGLAAYFRARELKRLARKSDAEDTPVEIPEHYLDDFPLYPIIGNMDAAVLPREELLDDIMGQIDGWSERRTMGSLAIVGEKGIGKSTLVGGLVPRVKGLDVVYHTLQAKRITEADLVAELAPMFGIDAVHDCTELATALNQGGDRLVLLDDAHNTFMRTIGGFRGFDALVRLVNATQERVFWVVVFNRFAWRFINASRKREHYFRRLIELPRWSAADLQNLIGLRNRRSGFTIKFDEMLLDEDIGGGGQFQLIEGADGFFRLLWQASRGNPRIATYLWLSALRPVGPQELSVGLIRTPKNETLDKLGDDLFFALAAVCQHENLTVPELQESLNASLDFAGFAIRILREYGLLEEKPNNNERFTLAPRYYQQVLDTLRSKHLLFEE